MEKLTKEDIQFIDNYLLRSEVVYKDIRVEMIDHIATAVEARMQSENEVFYDVFKAYMIENKKSLLAGEATQIKQVRKTIFKSILKQCVSVHNLLFAVLVYVLHYLAFQEFNWHLETYFYIIYTIGVYVLFAVYIFIKNGFFVNDKYSALGIMFSINFLIYVPHSIFSSLLVNTKNKLVVFLIYTLITLVLLAYWQVAGAHMKKYHNKYNFS